MSVVYIGIGSNIDPETNLAACSAMLKADYPDIHFSSVYETAPQDAVDQANFLNAVAKIETDETPEEIHEVLRQIERDLGKDPPYPKGPRTIDADILLYDNLVSDTMSLNVPHPRMHQRRFVLEPLCEFIDPNTKHPTLEKSWKELLKETAKQRCTKSNFWL